MSMYKSEKLQAVRPATVQDLGANPDHDADIGDHVTITMVNGLTLTVPRAEVTGMPDEPLTAEEHARLATLRNQPVRSAVEMEEILELEHRPPMVSTLAGHHRAELADVPLTPASEARLAELRAKTSRSTAEDAEMARLDGTHMAGKPMPTGPTAPELRAKEQMAAPAVAAAANADPRAKRP